MTNLTREGWDAARERLSRKARDIPLNAFPAELDGLAEAVLGCPRPPKPAPPAWRASGGDGAGSILVTHHAGGGVWVGWPHKLHGQLTPDEADAMACALVEHADYARKQEAKPRSVAGPLIPAPICGRVLVGWSADSRDPVCQKPSGHTEFCQKGYDE